MTIIGRLMLFEAVTGVPKVRVVSFAMEPAMTLVLVPSVLSLYEMTKEVGLVEASWPTEREAVLLENTTDVPKVMVVPEMKPAMAVSLPMPPLS